jgi:ribonuclease HI
VSVRITDAFHAELNAIAHAVQLAEQLGVIHIVLGTDSQLLMMALNKRGADASPLSVIIDDLKFQFSTKFASCTITFCKRELNRPAHELAHLGWLLWEYDVTTGIMWYADGRLPSA